MIKEYLEKYQIFLLFIAIAIAIFIFYISSLSFEKGTPLGIRLLPTIYHFSVFLALTFFLLAGIVGKTHDKTLIITIILLAMVYAISDETHQLFVPNRSCDINDFLIDSTGILLSSITYVWLKFKD